MFIFREHRGSLAESMATIVKLETKKELIDYIRVLLDPFMFDFNDDDLKIERYGFDERIGWDTQIVTIEKYGVVGFINGII